MRSLYHVACICGEHLVRERCGEGRCPKCQRRFVMEWQAEVKPLAPLVEAKAVDGYYSPTGWRAL